LEDYDGISVETMVVTLGLGGHDKRKDGGNPEIVITLEKLDLRLQTEWLGRTSDPKKGHLPRFRVEGGFGKDTRRKRRRDRKTHKK